MEPLQIAIAGGGSLLLVWFLTPIARRLAPRLGTMDVPSAISVHTLPIPRLGGLAIVIALAASILASQLAGETTSAERRQLLIVLLGSLAFFTLGLLDDRYHISPLRKLVATLAIAAVTSPWLLDISQIPPVISIGIATAWTTALVHSFNLIDGLDGLAAGNAFISALAFLIFGLLYQQPATAILAVAIAGASLAFLRYNWHPAKIFLGDSGSLLLGFALAQPPLLLASHLEPSLSLLGLALVLGLPLYDALLTVLRRLYRRQPLFVPDRAHFYNQLMERRGIPHVRTVTLCHLLALGLAGVAAAVVLSPGWWPILETSAILALALFATLRLNLVQYEVANAG